MPEVAVGQRIELNDGRTGIVRFTGQTAFAGGDWVGVELDDDTGKNDGSVQGERYFDCAMGHGMFVRATTLTILAQAAAPAPKVASARRAPRPSSILTTGSSRVASSGDAGQAKRSSFNAPSPSPGGRTSQTSSLVRSPSKSPTKQLATAVSRTGTPLSARGVPSARSRSSTGFSSWGAVGPPPLPGSSGPGTRQVSAASSTTSRGGGLGIRPASGRLSVSWRAGLSRPEVSRASSGSTGSPSEAKKREAARGGTGTDSSRRSAGSAEDEDASSSAAAVKKPLRNGAEITLPPTPRTAATGAASAGTAAREIETLKAKLRVLENKRVGDRDKLRSLEQLQGERDKFERIIQTLQIKYQPQQQENMDLKRQLREAEARLESIEATQVEHDSAMELATLDREMAEEMAEVLRTELDMVKQKAEELELERDILKDENAEFTMGMSSEERTSTGWLQMERNNERLREALVRLRDLTQQQEEELRDRIKGLEEDVVDLEAEREAHAACRGRLTHAETAVEDLRQQLDTALGAEDMIEELTARNMAQEEEVRELRATVADLESLQEISNELEVHHVQNARELQEELDLRDALVAEQARRQVQRDETVADLEYTLSRFRELVMSLQSDLDDMRASRAVTEAESEQLDARSRQMLDLNRKLQLTAARAQAKVIDLELGRLEAREARQHLEMVITFLPDTYRLADRDAALALLRFRRLACKADLLRRLVRERAADNERRASRHEDDVFWAYDAADRLAWVSAMCKRFERAMSHCDPERFARYEGALYELEPVERAINGWIEGLRREDLREQQCATELQRTMALMSHLAELHLASKSPSAGGPDRNSLGDLADGLYMQAVLVQSHLETAAAAFETAKTMVQRAMHAQRRQKEEAAGQNNKAVWDGDGPGEGAESLAHVDEAGAGQDAKTQRQGLEADDESELSQYFARKVEGVISQTRSAKVMAGKVVRALEELLSRSLSLAPDNGSVQDAFERCEQATCGLANLARQTGMDLFQLLRDEARVQPCTWAEVQDCARHSAARLTDSSAPANMEPDLFAAYLDQLRLVAVQVSDLAALSSDLTQTLEFERSEAPWVLRSRELRALHTVPVDVEDELRRLKEEHNAARTAVALREQKLSEATLKIETLEARMRNAKAREELVAQMEMQMNEVRDEAAKLRDDLGRQDRELKALETDRDRWRKVAGEGQAAQGDGAGLKGAGAAGTGDNSGDATAVSLSSRALDSMQADMAALQSAVRYFGEDSRRARLTETPNHAWLCEALRSKNRRRPHSQQSRAFLKAEVHHVLGELLRLAGDARLYDMSSLPDDKLAWKPARLSPQYHAAKQAEDLAAWQTWHNAVLRKCRPLSLRPSRPGPRWATDKRSAHVPAAARLHIQLPDHEANPAKLGTGPGRGQVMVVGSRAWEALQGQQGALV